MLCREINGDYSGNHTKCTNAVCGQMQIFECAGRTHSDHWTALLLWCDSSCANMAVRSGAETSRLYLWPLRLGRPRNRRLIRSRDEIFLFSKVPKAALEPTDPPCQWVHGVKRPGLEADHLPESSKGKRESRNRPGVAQRVPGGLGSQISWHSAREGGEVVSLTHRPSLPPAMVLVLIFTRDWVDPRAMERSEGDVTEKSSDTAGNRSRDSQLSLVPTLINVWSFTAICSRGLPRDSIIWTHTVMTLYPRLCGNLG